MLLLSRDGNVHQWKLTREDDRWSFSNKVLTGEESSNTPHDDDALLITCYFHVVMTMVWREKMMVFGAA